jgi:predicted nucleic acid-binding protein
MFEHRKVILDTNVIIDAFVRSRDARSRGSIELLKRIEKGDYIGVLPTPVLVEIYYVVLDVTHDPERARKTLRNLMALPNMSARAIEKEHALQAIEYIQRINYFHMGRGDKLGRRAEGLSMVDALILAMGKSIPGAIVCSNESKFNQVKDIVVIRPWELVGDRAEK